MSVETTVAYAEQLEAAIADIRDLCDRRERNNQGALFMPPLVSTGAIRRILRRYNV